MRSFDKVVQALRDAAVEPWRSVLEDVVQRGEIMMCLRWNYDNGTLVRMAVQSAMPGVIASVRSSDASFRGEDGGGVKCRGQVLRILSEMRAATDKVAGTDMEDVACAARDLLSNGRVGTSLADDLLRMAVRTDAMDMAVQTCMSACACKFSALGAPIASRSDEDGP